MSAVNIPSKHTVFKTKSPSASAPCAKTRDSHRLREVRLDKNDFLQLDKYVLLLRYLNNRLRHPSRKGTWPPKRASELKSPFHRLQSSGNMHAPPPHSSSPIGGGGTGGNNNESLQRAGISVQKIVATMDIPLPGQNTPPVDSTAGGVIRRGRKKGLHVLICFD